MSIMDINQKGIQREAGKVIDLHEALHERGWAHFEVMDILTKYKKRLIKSTKRKERRENTIKIEDCTNSGTKYARY